MVTDDGAAPLVAACPDKAWNHGRKLAVAVAKLYDKTDPTGQWSLNYGYAKVSLKTKRAPTGSRKQGGSWISGMPIKRKRSIRSLSWLITVMLKLSS